jgi:hypothetical protein
MRLNRDGHDAVSGGFLVLRRDGATWAVAHPEVLGLARRGGGFEVTVAAGTLAADEVLGVTAELRCHPAGRVLRRFWPEAAQGLAVHGELPVVLIDPQAPPRSLMATGADPAAAAARGAGGGPGAEAGAGTGAGEEGVS